MTATEVLARAKAAGIALWVDGDQIRYRGPKQADAELLPRLRAQKRELLSALAEVSLKAFWRWRITLRDGHSFDAFYSPEATREDVERYYPGADVQPLNADDRPRRPATPQEAAELRRLVAVIYAEDSEADRVEAIALALSDAECALECYHSIGTRRGLDSLRREES